MVVSKIDKKDLKVDTDRAQRSAFLQCVYKSRLKSRQELQISPVSYSRAKSPNLASSGSRGSCARVTVDPSQSNTYQSNYTSSPPPHSPPPHTPLYHINWWFRSTRREPFVLATLESATVLDSRLSRCSSVHDRLVLLHKPPRTRSLSPSSRQAIYLSKEAAGARARGQGLGWLEAIDAWEELVARLAWMAALREERRIVRPLHRAEGSALVREHTL
jgi:hypothetical protein